MPDTLDTPTTSTRSAYERIGIVLHELIQRHPRLGLTFGYIGNLERWGDDRGWKVFTACSRPSGFAKSVSWGDYPTSHLDQMADAAEQHLGGWCARIEAEIDSGKILADPKTRTKR
jgi:hypothetical protein